MTPAEIEAMVTAFSILEPPIQAAIASLIHKMAAGNQAVAAANAAAIAAGVDPSLLPKP